jgi:hypothetical protein
MKGERNMMKKILILILVGILVLSGFGVAAVTNNKATTITNSLATTDNHPPYAPSNYYPCGELDIDVNVNLSWDGGDPDPGDTVTYTIFLGKDPIHLDLIAIVGPYPWNQTRIEYNPGTLEYCTKYCMMIAAHDNHNTSTIGSICCFITKCVNDPPSVPIIDGEKGVIVGKEFDYYFSAIDFDEDDVRFHIDWGDGNSELTDFVHSGKVATVDHTFLKKGTIIISAYAEDIHGAVGDEGRYIVEWKNKNKAINIPVQNLIQQHSPAGSQQSSSLPSSITSGVTLLSKKQLESKESENLEKLQFPVVVVHITEIYGTLDDPQRRPLANVKVKITEFPQWRAYWRGTTTENGTTEEIKVERGFLYFVYVSKYGYHVYGYPSHKTVGIDEGIKTYDVYFLMAENGSPFTKQISQISQQSSSIPSNKNTMDVISPAKTSVYDGSLSGYITDSLMNPIEGALVRVYFHETYEENYSDENGYYHVTNIPICYCLKNATCSKDGYIPEWVLLSITENTTYDFVLTPNHPPSAPTITGPSSGKVGQELTFIFNAVDPDNDDVKYEINWGDGNEETTGLRPSGTDVTVKHTWMTKGAYTIIAKAQDEHGLDGPEANPPIVSITKNKDKAINILIQNLIQQHSSVGSQQSVSLPSSQNVMNIVSLTDTMISENHPPTPPIMQGPCFPKVNVSYAYGFSSNDLDGDNLSYYIDWGDGTVDGWTHPYHPNQYVLIAHTYHKSGQYMVTAKAKDVPYNTESNESYFLIRVPPFGKIRNAMTENHPPNAPVIDGPKGKIQFVPMIELEFNISAIDPDGDDVRFYIDWQDATGGTKTNFFKSGEIVTVSHMFRGMVPFIYAYAEDSHNATGPTSMYKVEWKSKGQSSQQSFNLLFFKIVQRLLNTR